MRVDEHVGWSLLREPLIDLLLQKIYASASEISKNHKSKLFVKLFFSVSPITVMLLLVLCTETPHLILKRHYRKKPKGNLQAHVGGHVE